MSNPHAWQVTWAQQNVQKRLDALKAYEEEQGLPGYKLQDAGDVKWLMLERSYHLAQIFLMRDEASHRAYVERTRNHKTLAKQYGIASEKIRSLKGEIAILQVKLFESRDDSRKNRLRAVRAERQLAQIERDSHVNERL
jgi:hypothetical protein